MKLYKNLQEIADLYNISLPTLRKKIKTGEIQVEKVPKGLYYYLK